MFYSLRLILLTVFCCLMSCCYAVAQQPEITGSTDRVVTVKPDYLPPAEILDILGVTESGGQRLLQWRSSDGRHTVVIRSNDAANLLILSGEAADVDFAERLIREADVAPRQIEIEVKIIEISTSKARDIGIDWGDLIGKSRSTSAWRYYESEQDEKQIRRDLNLSVSISAIDAIQVLDQSGAATVRTAPRILTLNNRRATIVDGQRVTYVTRYSSYTNLFETDSLDAGLTVSVLPSLGESGYITLHINAELTTLNGSISGSPVKDGQMFENTIIVRDGETVLLGGLSRTTENSVHKRFPLLGHILPFLFSREIKTYEEVESYLLLTPHVVDLIPNVAGELDSIFDGK